MTQDEIIRMAREVGLPHWYHNGEPVNVELLERFADLVAAYERKKCEQEMKQQLIDQQMQMYDKNVIDCKQAAIEAIEAAVLAEREACAKVCEKRETSYQYATDPWALEHIMEAQYCATDIRARGDK